MGIAADIDQKVSQDAVDQPGLAFFIGAGDLIEGKLKLIEPVVTSLIDTRCLARRTDEQSREQIAQTRMVLPIGNEAAKQVRPPQERALRRCRATDDDMVAAARAGMASVEQKLFGTKACEARLLIEGLRDLNHLTPIVRRLDVDLEDARVRCDLDHVEPRVRRWSIAFDMDGHLALCRRIFHRGNQIQIVLKTFCRRHENAKPAIARFD